MSLYIHFSRRTKFYFASEKCHIIPYAAPKHTKTSRKRLGNIHKRFVNVSQVPTPYKQALLSKPPNDAQPQAEHSLSFMLNG